MNKKITPFLLAMLLAVSGTAFAAEHTHTQHPSGAAQAVQWADGVVVKINDQRGKLTLRHGDIAGVMSAMTMAYPVQDAQVLKSLQVGDKVRFVLQQRQDQYLVTQIETVQ